MKKLRCVFFLIVFLSGPFAHAQLAVIAAATDTILAASGIEQFIYYIQSMAQLVTNVQHAYDQLQNMIRAEQRVIRNLRGITDIKSWDDFMSWYNRQLYLEKQVEEKFNNLGVKIGKKTYHVKDIADIPYALKETYVDYWDEEFTEEQRREMWINLGLTPSNYAYIQTWKQREKDLIKKFLTKPEIQNDEYMEAMTRNSELADRLAEDRNKSDDDRMGEKEIASMEVEISIATNKTINDIAMTLAEMQEMQATQLLKNLTPDDSPPVSESWDKSYFGKF
jgi:hypothetical protein